MSKAAELTSVIILDRTGDHYMDNVMALKCDAITRAREELDHLSEYRDYFFVETGHMTVEVFFISKKEAVLFKLRF